MTPETESPLKPRPKRLRSSSPISEDENFQKFDDTSRASMDEPESESYDVGDQLHEWGEPLQADAIAQGKEDAELETGFVRLEDLDERITRILAGITSKKPTEALTEFRELLRGVDGGKFLQQYVLMSPKCTEIMSAWSLGPVAESAVPLLLLVDEIMRHPLGKDGAQDSLGAFQHGNADPQKILLLVRARLDKLARSIVSTKLKDIYAHLTSNERRRQKAALLLMASIVKRGSMLASEVATTFDFNLNVLPKLSKPAKGYEHKKGERKVDNVLKRTTRFAFIEFALSFLEVCHTALLRWVLQIRPLYAGVLHKLASDDEMTIVAVLKIFQNKVLDSAAMVPPGLQSAIFGDATLDQLAIISCSSLQFEAAQIAHDTLLLLCTDPSHGLCPEPSLSWGATTGKSGTYGGGQGRLVRLMLKLRATENQNHRELLLSIAAGRPLLVATYFESFPYSLEPRASAAWFAAVLLISEIIHVTKVSPPFSVLAAQGLPPPAFDSPLVQGMLRSALPRNLTRLMINRALLHANILVKHGCLRMLLEVLSSVEFYLSSVFNAQVTFQQKHSTRDSSEQTAENMAGEQQVLESFVGGSIEPNSSVGLFAWNNIKVLARDSGCKNWFNCQRWLALGKYIQDELRSMLPDPQVLLSLLPLKHANFEDFAVSKSNKNEVFPEGISINTTVDKSNLKREGFPENDGDVVFGDDRSDALDHRENEVAMLGQIWNADSDLIETGDLEDIGSFLNAKLLEVLAAYQRIIPIALVDSCFDVFKLLPDEPLSLPCSQQKALLTLLLAATGESSVLNVGYTSQAGGENPHLRHLYTHLKPLIKVMLGSKIVWMREQAQCLVDRAMASSGSFESNKNEISVWLHSLTPQSDAVISFLCDAVSTIGRNIDKHLDVLVSIIYSDTKEDAFGTTEFGPLVVCILDKCLRVLASSTKNLKLPQRTSISLYVATTLELLLQSQAYPKPLGVVINALLCSGLKNNGQSLENMNSFRSDWNPLQRLYLYVQCVLRKEDKISFWDSDSYKLAVKQKNFSIGHLAKAIQLCRQDERSSLHVKASALSSCLLCVPLEDIIDNLPLLMDNFFHIFKGKCPILMALHGAYKQLLFCIAERWPDLFNECLSLASSLAHSRKDMCKKSDLSQGQGKHILSGSSLSSTFEVEHTLTFSAASSSTTLALSAFLLALPFGIIFPAAAHSHEAQLLTSNVFRRILEAALAEVPLGQWLITARVILFWIQEIWILGQNGSDVAYQLETCFSLLKDLILPAEDKGWLTLLQKEQDTSTYLPLIEDLIKGVLAHPVMTVHQGNYEVPFPQQVPSVFDDKCNDCDLEADGLESWLSMGRCQLALIEYYTIDILKELLFWVSKLPKADLSAAALKSYKVAQRRVLACCKPFLTCIIDGMKKEVIDSQKNNLNGLLPSKTTFIAFSFLSLIDVHSLLVLAYTLLSQEPSDQNVDNRFATANGMPYHDVGVCITTLAFDRISLLSVQTETDEHVSIVRQWESEHVNMFEDCLLQDLYDKIVQLVLTRPSERAMACFLSALEALCKRGQSSHDQTVYKLSNAVLSHCIYRTPVQILRHLMIDLDKTKAKIVFLLVQVSQFYLLEFSEILSYSLGYIKNGLACTPSFRLASVILHPSQSMLNFTNAEYSLEEMILLLPAVHWFITKVVSNEQLPVNKFVEHVTLVYLKAITEMLKDWDTIVADVNKQDVLLYINKTEANKDSSKLIDLTTPGQIALMMEQCLAHHMLNSKERVDLFTVLFQKSYPLLDSSANFISMSSLEDTLKSVSSIIAKAMMARLLIFRDICEDESETTRPNCDTGTGILHGSRLQEMLQNTCHLQADSFDLANMLIQTLAIIFQQNVSGISEVEGVDCDLKSPGGGGKVTKSSLLNYLEMMLLNCLKEISRTRIPASREGQYTSLLTKFTKLVLRHRFGVRLPMKVLRCLASKLVRIPELAVHYGSYALDLLVGHSQFVPTLLSFGPSTKHTLLTGKNNEKDMNARSLSSVLYLLKSPYRQHSAGHQKNLDHLDKNSVEIKQEVLMGISRKLELLRLLRLLYHLKRHATESKISADPALNSNELLSLLLAAYGASMSKVDEANLLLMHEVESYEGAGFSGVVGMDFLWGEAALKRRQTKVEVDQGFSALETANEETIREVRKRWFKEDLVLDPVRCGLTVLFFPSRRKVFTEAVVLTRGFEDDDEGQLPTLESDEKVLTEAAYDPSFILTFALHSISSGWVDAEEFVLKGLLAIALASIASAEEGMRKLGYDVLAKFFTVLEDGPSFKGKPQIRLLLTFVKNAITEPWQRLPSVIALFAAEASCVLMNPSGVHYPVVNKFLFRAPSMDLENVPLFNTMFGSGSVHFRTARSWMLRLLFFGLRTSFDTHIYRRRFILEILMSFYTSPLGDQHTREWILQILHRASKLRSFVQYLIEHAGLLSWLSSITTSNGAAKSGEYAVGISSELAMNALKILENTLSWRSVKRWVLSDGFEELSKMASVLHTSIVRNSSFREQALFKKPALRILGTAFRLSCARRKFQTHLYFSIEDIVEVINYVEMEGTSTQILELRLLALRTILECSPPACSSVKKRVQLYEIGAWAVSVVLKCGISSSSLENFGSPVLNRSVDSSKRGNEAESLGVSVLRWLAASLILGRSSKDVVLQCPDTAWNFVQTVNRIHFDGGTSDIDIDRGLLRLLINLQCYIGMSAASTSLVSVICASAILMPEMGGPPLGAPSVSLAPKELEDLVERLLSEVSSPLEADRSWRWMPWNMMKDTPLCEFEACQMLIVLFQKFLHIKGYVELPSMVKVLKASFERLANIHFLERPTDSDHVHELSKLNALRRDLQKLWNV